MERCSRSCRSSCSFPTLQDEPIRGGGGGDGGMAEGSSLGSSSLQRRGGGVDPLVETLARERDELREKVRSMAEASRVDRIMATLAGFEGCLACLRGMRPELDLDGVTLESVHRWMFGKPLPGWVVTRLGGDRVAAPAPAAVADTDARSEVATRGAKEKALRVDRRKGAARRGAVHCQQQSPPRNKMHGIPLPKVCDLCGSGHNRTIMAQCSRCVESIRHLYCMDDLPHSIPESWTCETCEVALTEMDSFTKNYSPPNETENNGSLSRMIRDCAEMDACEQTSLVTANSS